MDLAAVTGTGPGGRVTTPDVEQAAVPSDGRSEPLSKMRQAIGKAMTASKTTIPHFYVSIDVDMTDADAWRREAEFEGGQHPSLSDLLVKAAALTLMDFPQLNCSLVDGGDVTFHSGVHIGLAVATDDGLRVPVICDADTLS